MPVEYAPTATSINTAPTENAQRRLIQCTRIGITIAAIKPAIEIEK
jgi:hypothetical protein